MTRPAPSRPGPAHVIENEQRDRLLLETIPHIVWMTAPDGETTYMNHRGVEVLGVPLSAILGSGWLRFIHPDDVDGAREAWASAVRTRAPYRTEYRVRHADGTYRWYLSQGVMRHESGEVEEAWVGTWTEIDDRHQAERARDLALERLRLQIALMPRGYVLFDARRRIVDWNRAAQRIFGFSREEMVGVAAPLDRIVPAAAPRREGGPAAFQLGSRELVAHAVLQHVTKDGSEITCEWSNAPLLDENGAFTGAVCLVEDVTEAQRVRNELAASDERFRQLAGSIRDVFWLASPADGRVVYVSPAYEEVWGRSCASLYASPRGWADSIHSDDRARVAEASLTSHLSGRYDEEYRIVRPDGKVRWIRHRATPVRDGAGEIVRIAGVAEDVTGRRDLEAQVGQVQKMEAFGQLAGGVAHDFNNLLTIIIGYSELLLPSLAEHPDREFLEEIQKAAERSAALTRQLLAFSRKQIMDSQILDLNEVVRGAETLIRRVIGEDIVITVKCGASLHSVKADAGQLEQVLLNLAVNARDAMPQGGTLTFETANVELLPSDVQCLDGALPGPYAMLSVADSGTGITDDDQRHLFEPFFTTKEPGKGTGLGLAVTHGVIKQSGGCIDVVSAPGLGACFRMFLPAATGAEVLARPSAEAAVAVSGTETILLVEDDAGVRALTSRVLQQLGYTVLEAGDGEEALRVAGAAGTIDLLATDVVMPTLGGRMLADRLLETRQNLKVLYLSGYTDDAMMRHGVSEQKVNFLSKPFLPAILAEKVRATLRR